MSTPSPTVAPAPTAVIVEDDPAVRDLLIEVFESAGFIAIGAESGIEGVDAVRAHNPRITTIDVNMPGIDGFECARSARPTSCS
jgi:two-component system OmpR family response regulator